MHAQPLTFEANRRRVATDGDPVGDKKLVYKKNYKKSFIFENYFVQKFCLTFETNWRRVATDGDPVEDKNSFKKLFY